MADLNQLTFRVRMIGALLAEADGLRISPGQFSAEATTQGILAVLRLATYEEELCKFPADWWQAFKGRWFPKWMLRLWPLKINSVWAIHKYPELAVPHLGREFVHLQIIPEEDVMRWKLARRKDNENPDKSQDQSHETQHEI